MAATRGLRSFLIFSASGLILMGGAGGSLQAAFAEGVAPTIESIVATRNSRIDFVIIDECPGDGCYVGSGE
jgi:hypothetical protein